MPVGFTLFVLVVLVGVLYIGVGHLDKRITVLESGQMTEIYRLQRVSPSGVTTVKEGSLKEITKRITAIDPTDSYIIFPVVAAVEPEPVAPVVEPDPEPDVMGAGLLSQKAEDDAAEDTAVMTQPMLHEQETESE